MTLLKKPDKFAGVSNLLLWFSSTLNSGCVKCMTSHLAQKAESFFDIEHRGNWLPAKTINAVIVPMYCTFRTLALLYHYAILKGHFVDIRLIKCPIVKYYCPILAGVRNVHFKA